MMHEPHYGFDVSPRTSGHSEWYAYIPNACNDDEKGSLNEFTGINFNIKNTKYASTKKSLGPATNYGLGRSGDRIPEKARFSAPIHHSTIVPSVHTAFKCFGFISEQTANCATYIINWLVFITEMKSVYSAVRTGSVNKAVCASSLKG